MYVPLFFTVEFSSLQLNVSLSSLQMFSVGILKKKTLVSACNLYVGELYSTTMTYAIFSLFSICSHNVCLVC